MLSTIGALALRLPQAFGSIASRPIRTVLRWQFYISVALALVAAGWVGTHGAVSALLGGLINVTAGLVYAIMISSRRVKSAGETLRTLFRAEATKIALIVIQLWLALTAYHHIVPLAFFAVFFIGVLIFPVALLVRE
jgi:ATP synthase protein I